MRGLTKVGLIRRKGTRTLALKIDAHDNIPLVDMSPVGEDNVVTMSKPIAPTGYRRAVAFGVTLSLAGFVLFLNGALAAPPLEYCPNRTPDQQLGAAVKSPQPDCVPLVDKKETAGDEDRRAAEKGRELRIENLQTEVIAFLQKYNQFIECCKTDLAELQTIDALGDEVGELLAVAQSGLFSEHVKLRGWTLRELLLPVAQARADLKTLREKLEHVATRREKLAELDYEEAAREAARLREVEESLDRSIRSRSLPTGPKTGTSIGASPSVGSAIGKTPRTGAQIGAEGAVGTDIGANPRTGRDIGVTGPTGFEIGSTGRAGADIGDSSLNSDQSVVGSSLPPSTVGSSISDTTVGSSLGRSDVGSNLNDTSIGSTLGDSSIGSSIQNRSTGR
jgi:hypothetical protein